MTATSRRQATLFLRATASAKVEGLRARFNAVQHGLIRAHVTLLREDEVRDWDVVASRLNARGPTLVSLSFGAPVRDRDLVYLPTAGSTESFDRLRAELLAEGFGPIRAHAPHITLVHPRNATCSDAEFDAICRIYEPFSATFDAVTFIEQTAGEPWKELAAFR